MYCKIIFLMLQGEWRKSIYRDSLSYYLFYIFARIIRNFAASVAKITNFFLLVYFIQLPLAVQVVSKQIIITVEYR